MTTPYVDPQTVHNPATGTSPPASWGDTVRDDLEFLIAPPSVKANRTAVQSITSGTWTSVEFTAADSWDTDAFHSTTTNTSRFTIPTGLGGRYLLVGQVEMVAGTNTRAVRFSVNGTTTHKVADLYLSNSNIYAGSVSLELALVAADYVELQVWQATGGALDLSRATFSARWVSR